MLHRPSESLVACPPVMDLPSALLSSKLGFELRKPLGPLLVLGVFLDFTLFAGFRSGDRDAGDGKFEFEPVLGARDVRLLPAFGG